MAEISNLKIIFDLLLATSLGALIGIEREWAKKDPGIRTFSFVSLGSALFMILGRLVILKIGLGAYDPSRTLGQIIVGIGFLGAGIIIFNREEQRFQGLTTASMLWVTAAIGSAVGLGCYEIALVTALIMIIMNAFIRPIEIKLDKKIDEIKEKKKID
ncbi:MAG TPA: MgtC/SapB family protein [Candidatus Paceibacterota bacterium]|nr:MgtC/SapB family protein [Candidatus Paceibacterota bacterium]